MAYESLPFFQKLDVHSKFVGIHCTLCICFAALQHEQLTEHASKSSVNLA